MSENIQPKVENEITNETMISSIPVIRESVVFPKTREGLSQLVEAPLIEACQDLWDKNIQTLMSSANAGDAGHNGFIDISFDTLSEENKKVALSFDSEIKLMHGPEPRIKYLKLKIPIPATATVGDIKKIAKEIVSKFNKQPMTWADKITATELKAKFIRLYGEKDGQLAPENVADKYYDEATDTYYGSKEHYDKEHNL